MKLSNKNHKRLRNTAFALLLWGAVGAPVSQYACKRVENNAVKNYAQNNLVAIILEQEKRLGIKHKNIPKLQFGLHASYAGTVVDYRTIVYGSYDYKTRTINLTTGMLTLPEAHLLKKYLAKVLTINRVVLQDVKSTLDHELAHSYVHSIKKQKTFQDWPILSPSYSELCELLVDEGIATYFEKELNGGSPDFNENEFKEDVKNWGVRTIYDGGYTLFKPIIDKHRERGIAKIILDPPTELDLFNLPAYRQRILEELAGKSF